MSVVLDHLKMFFFHIETSPLPMNKRFALVAIEQGWSLIMPYLLWRFNRFLRRFLTNQQHFTTDNWYSPYSILDPYENSLYGNENLEPKTFENGLTCNFYNTFQEKNGDAQNMFPALVEILICMFKLFKNKESLKDFTQEPFQNYIL